MADAKMSSCPDLLSDPPKAGTGAGGWWSTRSPCTTPGGGREEAPAGEGSFGRVEGGNLEEIAGSFRSLHLATISILIRPLAAAFSTKESPETKPDFRLG